MAFFDYSSLPFGDWASHLKELNRVSSRGVMIRVYWGDHESLRGVRDFHSKSRLKLERVCSLAHSLKIPLHFRFGFYDEKRSFPVWAQSLEPQAVVPQRSEDEVISAWEFIRVPSFRNKEVREAFANFLMEALSLLALHKAPEGSLESVGFDWGVLRSDSYQMEPAFIETELGKQFSSIDRFNSLFQTNFNSFQAVSKPMGLKTILNKRPWIACWHYKSLKEKSFQIWENEISSLFERVGIPWSKNSVLEEPSQDIHSLIMDDTLLDLSEDQVSFQPLLIQGQMDPVVLRAFRVAEMLKLEALSRGDRISWLGPWTPSSHTKACVVICSKFITRKSFSVLSHFIESGGKVTFPFGAPNWDEHMESIRWNPAVSVSPSLEPNENLYDQLKGYFT